MDIDKFIRELERPLFVYKMARANKDHHVRYPHLDTHNMRQSAQTRMIKSAQEIEDVILRAHNEWAANG